MKPSAALWILAPLSLLAAVAAGNAVVSRSAEARGADGTFWDDEIAQFVRGMASSAYVDPVTDVQSRRLFDGAMRGYLRALPDDYDDYIPPEEYRKWKEDTAGSYAGLGVRVSGTEGGLRIDGVFPGGPASRAGMVIGDLVTHIEGTPLVGLDLLDPAALRPLKGAAGTRVALRVRSPVSPEAPTATPMTREVVVLRGTIRPPTVFARRVGADANVAYLRVTEFHEATPDDFIALLDRFVAAGATAVVVDLRDNPGGILTATERMADRFVSTGTIVRIAGRAPHTTRTAIARAEGTISDAVRLFVLVNGASASASEVFAGCIQDHRRGVLVGTRTYGKFLVQNVTEIAGKGSAVKLTTARYQTPNGRWFSRDPRHPEDAAGLTPDYVVPVTKAEAERLGQAWQDEEDAAWGMPARHPEAKDAPDPQLARVLELLGGGLLSQEIRKGTRENG